MKNAIISILFSILSNHLYATLTPEVDLYANFETIGINVIYRGGNFPSAQTSANIFYNETAATNRTALQVGFPLTKVNDSIYTGSLFWLQPNVNYTIKIEIIDSSNSNSNFIQTFSKSTRKEIEFLAVSKSWYVSPSGNSNLFTAAHPGGLKAALDSVKTGQEVVLLGGNYYFGEYNILKSGITIRGEEGQTAILDGSMPVNPTFTKEQNTAVDVYKATLPIPYSNCLFYNGKRLYPYKSKKELNRFNYDGFNLTTNPFLYDSILNIGLPGYFRDDRILNCNATSEYRLYPSKSIWVKFPDGTNPNTSNLKISQKRYCFNVENINSVNFKNLTVQYYGVWPEVRGILFNNTNNCIVSECKFLGNNYSIVIDGASGNNTFQNNEFIDGMQDWDTYMMKSTTNEGFCGIDEFGNQLTYTCHLLVPDPPIFPPSIPISYPAITYYPQPSARQMELSAISIGKSNYSGRGNVIRNNIFRNLESMSLGFGFSGGGEYFETTCEMDVYGNDITNSFDDGLEVDGLAGNIRFWYNTFTNTGDMFSLAPLRRGPVYMLRNVGRDFNTGRFYLNDKSKLIVGEGSPLKFNCGDENNFCASSGTSYFINNTVYHKKEIGLKYGFGLWLFNIPSSPLKNLFIKNNIFRTENNLAININLPEQIDLDYNLYFNNSNENFASVNNRQPIGINGNYSTFSSFKSATGFELNGFYEQPTFLDEFNNDFTPQLGGNLVDKGLLIPGINHNFCGLLPDLGAIELGCSVGILDQVNENNIRIYPNPNNGKFIFQTEREGQVKIYNALGSIIIDIHVLNGNNLINFPEQKIVSGLYFLKFEHDNKIENIRFMVK